MSVNDRTFNHRGELIQKRVGHRRTIIHREELTTEELTTEKN